MGGEPRRVDIREVLFDGALLFAALQDARITSAGIFAEESLREGSRERRRADDLDASERVPASTRQKNAVRVFAGRANPKDEPRLVRIVDVDSRDRRLFRELAEEIDCQVPFHRCDRRRRSG